MLEHTNFIIEIVANCNIYYNIVDIIELLVSNIDILDSHKIHLILSMLDENDGHRYEIFNILNKKINAIVVEDLVYILKCFEKDNFKYEIFIKLIKKCLPSIDYNDIILNIKDELLQIEMNNIIKNTKNFIKLNELLLSLKNFDNSERIELLESSISGTGIELKDQHLHCEDIKHIFGSNYEDSCDILGINPEIYKDYV